MNKKKCPQCKNLISASAPTCLFCGRPNKFVTKEYINKKWNIDKNKNYLITYKLKNLLFIFLLIIIISIIFIYR